MDQNIGRMVLGYDGYTEREGQIISEEKDRFGETYLIAWEDAINGVRLESFFKRQMKPISERCGIGVYLT